MTTKLYQEQVQSKISKKNSNQKKNTDGLMKFRICFYTLSTAHLLWLLITLYPLDLSSSSNLHVRRTGAIRQILYTVWTNYLQLIYFPLSLYLEWKCLQGQHMTQTYGKLMKCRNVLFTSLVCPTTMYVGFFFWRVWNYDRSLVVPTEFDEFLPPWKQHNLHTVNMVVCLVDFFVVPRSKPHSTAFEIKILNLFMTSYIMGLMIVYHFVGFWPYPMFNGSSNWVLVIFVFSFYMEHLFFYHAQWYLSKLIWNERKNSFATGVKSLRLYG